MRDGRFIVVLGLNDVVISVDLVHTCLHMCGEGLMGEEWANLPSVSVDER